MLISHYLLRACSACTSPLPQQLPLSAQVPHPHGTPPHLGSPKPSLRGRPGRAGPHRRGDHARSGQPGACAPLRLAGHRRQGHGPAGPAAARGRRVHAARGHRPPGALDGQAGARRRPGWRSAARCAAGPTEAREPLRRALKLADRCGADGLAAEVRAEIYATGARPRTAALQGAESLTASERRVADLAADGRSNKEIAQKLYVIPKTVEVHLSSADRMLSIRSRQQLALALSA